jgi:hypothetical protein
MPLAFGRPAADRSLVSSERKIIANPGQTRRLAPKSGPKKNPLRGVARCQIQKTTDSSASKLQVSQS